MSGGGCYAALIIGIGGAIMSSQRVSRGFHRLAVFLAAIPFLLGGIWSLTTATEQASKDLKQHEREVSLACARDRLKELGDEPNFHEQFLTSDFKSRSAIEAGGEFKHPADLPSGYHLDKEEIDLSKLGCSQTAGEYATVGGTFDVPDPTDFSYANALLPSLALGLSLTIALSLAVYGLVRAIGWVIGGFAAS